MQPRENIEQILIDIMDEEISSPEYQELLHKLISDRKPGAILRPDVLYTVKVDNQPAKMVVLKQKIAITQSEQGLVGYTMDEKLSSDSATLVYRSQHKIACFPVNKKPIIRIAMESNAIAFHDLPEAGKEQDNVFQQIIDNAKILNQYAMLRGIQRTAKEAWIVTELQPARTLDKIDFSEMGIEKRFALVLDICGLLNNLYKIGQRNLTPTQIRYDDRTRRMQVMPGEFKCSERDEEVLEAASKSVICSAAPILALVFGCKLTESNGKYNFSTLEQCLPDWLKTLRLPSEVIRIPKAYVGLRVDETISIVEFIARMTDENSSRRPNVQQIQRFFNEVNKRIILKRNEAVSQLQTLMSLPSSPEMNTQIKVALYTEPSLQEEKAEAVLREQRKGKTRGFVYQVEGLLNLVVKAQKETGEFKGLIEQVRGIHQQQLMIFPKAVADATQLFIVKIEKNELTREQVEQKIVRYKQEILARNRELVNEALKQNQQLLIENIQALHQHLLSAKFLSTNSSGLKQMKNLVRTQQAPLLKLAALIEVAESKATGGQWWSRSSFFGKGRHQNVDDLYIKIAKLKSLSLEQKVVQLAALNAELAGDKEYVFQGCCL